MLKPVKALSFDLNSTLLDGSRGREAIIRTCRDIAAQTGLDPGRLFEANSQVWQGYWPQVEDKWTLGVLDGEAVSLEAWRRTLLICGCDDESLARGARESHRQYGLEALRLFDDVPQVFSLLKTGLSCALVTNGASDTQRDALRVLGIERHFGAVVISGEVGIAKPHASIFGFALEKLGVEPENVWHVGDSLTARVAGAKAAGISAVWLNRGGLPWKEGDPKPDYEIQSLTEIAALLGKTQP